jgi:hypothetical protein
MTYVYSSICLVTILTSSQVYLNIVLDDALEEKPGGEKARIGMVVIRGNAVVMLEVWRCRSNKLKSHVAMLMLRRHSIGSTQTSTREADERDIGSIPHDQKDRLFPGYGFKGGDNRRCGHWLVGNPPSSSLCSVA